MATEKKEAHLNLANNEIVVMCSDGTTSFHTGKFVDRAHPERVTVALIDQAISNAIDKVPNDDKAHLGEINELLSREPAEAALVRGLLKPVEERAAARAPAPAKPESVPPRRSEIDMTWLKTRLDECKGGEKRDGLKAVAALYGSRDLLDRQTASDAQQAAATITVFTALSEMPAFAGPASYLTTAQAKDYKDFKELSKYVETYRGLIGAGSDMNMIKAANTYIRYFLLALRAQQIHDYAQEVGQLPTCKKAMDRLQQQLLGLTPLAGPMDTQTIIAAALYIRRWNLTDVQHVHENEVQPWQTPETLAAAQRMMSQLPKITGFVDTTNREIKVDMARIKVK